MVKKNALILLADNISAKKINNLNMTDLVWKTMAPGQVITGKKNLTGKMDIQVFSLCCFNLLVLFETYF